MRRRRNLALYTLHWDDRNDALGTRCHPLEALRHKTENHSSERREKKYTVPKQRQLQDTLKSQDMDRNEKDGRSLRKKSRERKFRSKRITTLFLSTAS